MAVRATYDSTLILYVRLSWTAAGLQLTVEHQADISLWASGPQG